MSSTAHRHRTFPSMPRDYIRRRQVNRRIANLILIPALSIVAAYLITRSGSRTAFSAPKASPEFTQASTGSSNVPLVGSTVSFKSSVAGLSSAGYKLADGPHAVTELSDLVLTDTKRHKELHLRIFYPSGAGPFPVIIFSHGAGGSQNCCDQLTRHWASYGFVTLQPTHEDSVAQRRVSATEDETYLAAVRGALKKPALWQSRLLDISFLLDSLPSLPDHVPALAGKLDSHHVGVGGHSMGAFTADAMAGALVDLPDHPASNFADPRVRAVLLLSPQGPGEFGLTQASWDHVSTPLLSMTGSLDRAANGQGPDWKRIPFDRSLPGDKYHVLINGANHLSFISARTILPARAAQGEMILAYTNSASLAFWDAYLRSDPAAKDYLRSDALPRFSNGAVRLYRR